MSLDQKISDVKMILGELQHGPQPWSELEARMLSRGGTHWKFTFIMDWLTDKGYINKCGPSGSRASYSLNLEKVHFEDGDLSIKL